MSAASFGINDPAAFLAAIDSELEDTTREGVELLRKGRQTQAEADYVTGLIRDIRSDLVHAFGDLPIGANQERAAPAVRWRDKVRWIRREVERREADFPEAIRKGRLTPQEGRVRLKIVTTLYRLYWQDAFMWEPEPGPALDYMNALRSGTAQSEEAQLIGRATVREALRLHVAAVDLERNEAQGSLVA